jgi:hypothetical protein
MQLNHIVKSLLITGLFTTSSLPLLAAEAPKDATAATQQANNLLYNQLPLPITLTLLMPIKVLLPLSLKT